MILQHDLRKHSANNNNIQKISSRPNGQKTPGPCRILPPIADGRPHTHAAPSVYLFKHMCWLLSPMRFPCDSPRPTDRCLHLSHHARLYVCFVPFAARMAVSLCHSSSRISFLPLHFIVCLLFVVVARKNEWKNDFGRWRGDDTQERDRETERYSAKGEPCAWFTNWCFYDDPFFVAPVVVGPL